MPALAGQLYLRNIPNLTRVRGIGEKNPQTNIRDEIVDYIEEKKQPGLVVVEL